MNWKPIKDVPTKGHEKLLLFYIPHRFEKFRIGYAHPIDEECNRDRVMFTDVHSLGFFQRNEQPTYYSELEKPTK